MKSRLIPLIFPLALALLACGQQPEKTAQKPPPPPEIPVVVMAPEKVTIHQDFVGQTYGAQDIAIRARVEGFLEGIHFQEGTTVEKGRLLYTIESLPFEAEVAAQMSKVAEAKIMLVKATSDLNRIRPLAERKAVSRSDLDAAVAEYEAAQASVEAAEANLRSSEIKKSYTLIKSPITGLIGKTNAKVGDFVGRSFDTTVLNEVSNIETVRVQFFLTENQYLKLVRRYLQDKQERSGGDWEEEQRTLALILADGSMYEHSGQFDFLDRQVDPTTGAILIQATFPNPDKWLRPGQFAKVRAEVDVVEDAIMIPPRCVIERQGRYSVYVVGDGNKVSQRDVTVGPAIENRWMISAGLQAGEKVVYEGLQKIGDGMVVTPRVTSIEPSNRKAK